MNATDIAIQIAALERKLGSRYGAPAGTIARIAELRQRLARLG